MFKIEVPRKAEGGATDYSTIQVAKGDASLNQAGKECQEYVAFGIVWRRIRMDDVAAFEKATKVG